MKKFFAFFTIIALFALTGSAFAAELAVSVSPSTINVVVGNSGTATVSGTAGHNGTLAYSVNSAEGITASISGTTLTVTPAAAGAYTLVVTATETYTAEDAAGHASTQTATATASVRVVATTTPTPTPTPVPETVTEVKVIDPGMASMPTIEQQSNIIVIVLQSARNLVSTFMQNFASKGIVVPAGTTVQGGDNMVAATTNNFTPGDNAGNLQRASAILKGTTGGNSARVVGVPTPFTPQRSGFQPINMPKIDAAFNGYPLGMYMGRSGSSRTRNVGDANDILAAADSDYNDTVFLNSNGEPVTTVPDGTNGAQGEVTAIAYVEAGEVYEPILFLEVSEAQEAAFDQASGTTTEDVVIEVEENPDALSLTASPTALTVQVGQTGNVTLTATNLIGMASYTVTAEVGSGATVTESTAATTTATLKPTVAGTYRVVFTVIDDGRAVGSDSANTVVTLTATARNNPGSSGGGCSAGFAGLSLAVLGAFIALRRK